MNGATDVVQGGAQYDMYKYLFRQLKEAAINKSPTSRSGVVAKDLEKIQDTAQRLTSSRQGYYVYRTYRVLFSYHTAKRSSRETLKLR